MTSPVTLTRELELLRRQFKPFEKTGLSLTGGEVVRLTKRISLITKLARTVETELSIHRLSEAGKQQAATIEQLTQDVAGALILSADGNVVRPDFTKGGR